MYCLVMTPLTIRPFFSVYMFVSSRLTSRSKVWNLTNDFTNVGGEEKEAKDVSYAEFFSATVLNYDDVIMAAESRFHFSWNGEAA